MKRYKIEFSIILIDHLGCQDNGSEIFVIFIRVKFNAEIVKYLNQMTGRYKKLEKNSRILEITETTFTRAERNTF